MDIYFCGSIRGGRDDARLYRDIIKLLAEHGTVLTSHVADAELDASGSDAPVADIHARSMDWLQQADAVVAEVTQPSLGVGYEVAVGAGEKPVLCLFRPDAGFSLSAMIRGCPDASVHEYEDVDELDAVFETFLR